MFRTAVPNFIFGYIRVPFRPHSVRFLPFNGSNTWVPDSTMFFLPFQSRETAGVPLPPPASDLRDLKPPLLLLASPRSSSSPRARSVRSSLLPTSCPTAPPNPAPSSTTTLQTPPPSRSAGSASRASRHAGPPSRSPPSGPTLTGAAPPSASLASTPPPPPRPLPGFYSFAPAQAPSPTAATHSPPPRAPVSRTHAPLSDAKNI